MGKKKNKTTPLMSRAEKIKMLLIEGKNENPAENFDNDVKCQVLSTNGLLDSTPSGNDGEIMSNAVQHGLSISDNEQLLNVSNQSITSTEIIYNALTDKSLLSELDFDRMEFDDDVLLQVADETASLLVESTTAMQEELCEEVTQPLDFNQHTVSHQTLEEELICEEVTQSLDSDQHTVNNQTFERELICEEVIQLIDVEQQITCNQTHEEKFVCEEISEPISLDQHTASDQTHEEEFVCEEISEPISLDQHTASDQTHEEDAIGPKRLKKPNTSRWIQLSNQGKRKRGEEYHGVKKVSDSWHYDVPRPAKRMKEHCNCSLSKKSGRINCNLFQEIERQNLFDQFWKEFGWDQRRTHIQDMVDSLPTKDLKNKQNEVSRREMSLVYNLKLDGKRLRVCKKMFLNTYSITDWVVLNWLKKPTNKDSLTNIKKYSIETKNQSKRVCKRNFEKCAFLKEFLESLPKLESHYCRKGTKKLYLEPIFTSKREVYDLFRKKCEESQKECVSIKMFHEEFESQNLSIYTPRKDQCDLCTSFKTGNIEEIKYKEHLVKKETARNEKNTDNNSSNHVLTVDLQAVLLSPFLKASALYYKTKLIVHNYTVFNNKNKEVVCYVWHEGQGGVTSNVFASLIANHIDEQLNPSPGETVIIWSDGCGYQNRNVNVTNSLLILAEKKQITIVQKYLERGHTQMECDSIHAQIEKKLQNKDIYVPANYIEIMKTSRKNPEPYTVKYIDHTFFKDFSKSCIINSIRPGERVGDSTVCDLSALKYTIVYFAINHMFTETHVLIDFSFIIFVKY